MEHLAHFFTGLLLCNALPHLVAGLQGQAFPTPFARPRGIGRSSPLINFLWGLLNLALGLLLLGNVPLILGANIGFALALLGALFIGCYLALHFGKHLQT